MNTPTGRPLILKTPLGTDGLLVAGLRGREAVSELFSLRLDLLADPSADIPFERLIGQPATVALRLAGQEPRYVSGILSRLVEGDADEHFVHVEAELVPAFWLWTKRIQSRVFQQLSVTQILNEVLKGLDVALELGRAYLPREYCVQYRETDFAFACRLMEEEGIYYYFRHASDGHTLVLTDTPPTSHAGTPVAYHPARGGQHSPMVWSWRKAQVVTTSKWVLRDYTFELPDHHLEATAEILDEAVAGAARHRLRGGFNDSLEVFEGVGGYSWHADDVGPDGSDRAANLPHLFEEARVQGRLRMEEAAARALEIRGQGDCGGIVPGANFTLTRHRNANGQYFLTHVEHEATQSGFRSGEEPAFHYENAFGCIPAAIRFRPPRSTPRPMMGGTQTATVVGPADRDTFVDRHGRVKVQFHWDRHGQRDGGSSCWVRVAQIWAGNRWGAFFWPRIGHEVVVAFEEGNPDRPMIVGSVYNANNVPPFDMPGGDLVAGIKSCSAGANVNPQANFNGILFYDRAGDEHVELHSENAERARTESDKQMRVGRSLTTVVGAMPSPDSGSGGGSAAGHVPVGSDGWGWIKPTLGRSINFVCGYAADVDLGSYSQCVVGQNYLIATNPMAFQLWAAGTPSAVICQGIGNGISGSVEVVLGGLVECRYGPKVEVHRGPCLETTSDANPLMVGLVALLNGCAISSNIVAAMVPDKIDTVIIALKALEALILGSLCALEAKDAWLEQAELNGELAKECLDFLRMTYERKLKDQGYSGQQLSDEIKTLVKDSATALKGLDKGAMVHDCSAYVLSAQKRAVLTAHDKDGEMLIMSPTLDVMVAKQFGLRGKYLEFLSDAGTQMGAKRSRSRAPRKLVRQALIWTTRASEHPSTGMGPR